MQTSASEPHSYEFYFASRDTLIRVEESDGDVIVRATRDTFSERQKSFFIRELAMEGFIPDSYIWASFAGSEAIRGVRWVVDISWLKLSEVMKVRAQRFMVRLLLSASISLLVVLIALVQY